MVNLNIRKQGKTWVFDDEAFGIISESFVEGTSELIDFISTKKGLEKRKSLSLTASQVKFPGSSFTELKKFDNKLKWSTYFHDEFGYHKLCPVLLVYFEEPPRIIYFDIK